MKQRERGKKGKEKRNVGGSTDYPKKAFYGADEGIGERQKEGTVNLAASYPINSQSELQHATLPCFSSVRIFVRA